MKRICLFLILCIILALSGPVAAKTTFIGIGTGGTGGTAGTGGTGATGGTGTGGGATGGDPITGDQFWTPVTWSGGDSLGLNKGDIVRLQFKLNSARIYGIKFDDQKALK